MHQQIAVVGQHPFSLGVSFHTDGQLSRLLFQLQIHFVADGLNLPLVGARTDYKEIREGSDAGKVQNLDVGSLFGFRGPDSDQPGWGSSLSFDGLLGVSLAQNTLLSVSYYGSACAGSRFIQWYAATEFFQKYFSATARPFAVKYSWAR